MTALSPLGQLAPQLLKFLEQLFPTLCVIVRVASSFRLFFQFSTQIEWLTMVFVGLTK